MSLINIFVTLNSFNLSNSIQWTEVWLRSSSYNSKLKLTEKSRNKYYWTKTVSLDLLRIEQFQSGSLLWIRCTKCLNWCLLDVINCRWVLKPSIDWKKIVKSFYFIFYSISPHMLNRKFGTLLLLKLSRSHWRVVWHKLKCVSQNELWCR
mgnify:CR=1 FL=1